MASPAPLSRYLVPFRTIAQRHRTHWSDPFARQATLTSLVVLAVSLVVQYYAIAYATAVASNPATDIFLSNVPIWDIDGVYVYGLILFITFIVLLLFANPKEAPFVIYSFALFLFIRSFFNSLTHIAPYPIPSSPDFNSTMKRIFFGGDLFFSGHTGSPFLMALIFWNEKVLRYVFWGLSIFFGIVVLLAHLHYSIDVAAAFFITYAIYHIALQVFPRSYELFKSDIPHSV